MKIEHRLEELGLVIPDFGKDGYYGGQWGKMKPYHRVGNVLHLSGHMPEWKGGKVNPGRVGGSVTLEAGYEAARITGLNVIGGLKQAVGDLDDVVAIVKALNFVACVPEFYEVNRVSSGLTDLMILVFGEDAGMSPRATIGVQSLSSDHCFETWVVAEVK